MFDQLFSTIMISTVAIILLTTVGSFAVFYMFARANRKKTEALLATGSQGMAAILSMEDTGMRINDDPRVRLLLNVTIPGYAPYQVQKTITVPMIKLAQVQPGMNIGVIADPTQPANPDKLGLLLR